MGAKPYAVKWAPRAVRDFKKLDRDVQRQIKPHIKRLKTNPRPSGVTKLRGSEDTYRLRSGAYRVIYEIRDREVLILVLRVRHRREAYRRD